MADPTNLGFLKWIDPYQKKEEHIHDTIKKENKQFLENLDRSSSALKTLVKKNRVDAEEHNPERVFEYPNANPVFMIKLPHMNLDYEWKLIKGSVWEEATNLDVSDDTIAYTYPDVKTNYKLAVKVAKGSSWTHKHNGGPFVAILGSRVVFIEGDEDLHYTRVVSMDLKTGRNKKVLYEEPSREKEIELVRCESRALFLSSYHSGIQTLHYVDRDKCVKLNPKGVAFFPIGKSSEPIYFVREGSFSAPWKLVGANWKLNSRIRADGIEFCSTAGILITKFYGIRTIWKLSAGEPVKLYSGIFEVSREGALLRWMEGPSNNLACVKPGSTVYHMNFAHCLKIQAGKSYGGDLDSGISISSDGLPVRWFILKPSKKPIGLVCVAYAAYGLPTSLNTTRWRSWVEAGWAISYLLVRGGGDGNEVWADLGRLKGKKRAIDDVEVCIKDLQRFTACKAENTALFGRSAGGLIVGNIAARWPSGDLVGIIYAEVPYVDLLKTAANPKLPLTEYEYKEFGNPRAGLVDFEAALEISPIHQLGPKGAPGIKVLCRSGLDDTQVFPYESLKWIEALRGGKSDATKILYIDNDGHHSNSVYKENAEDFTIINGWIK